MSAIGEATDVECLKNNSDISINRDSTITISEDLATTRPGVFAAGDAAFGPATVVAAVAQANKVAETIDAYLSGDAVAAAAFSSFGRMSEMFVPQQFNLDDYADARRPEMPELPLDKRARCMGEVELGLSEQTAIEECKRCLRCDLEWLQTVKKTAKEEPKEYIIETVHAAH